MVDDRADPLIFGHHRSWIHVGSWRHGHRLSHGHLGVYVVRYNHPYGREKQDTEKLSVVIADRNVYWILIAIHKARRHTLMIRWILALFSPDCGPCVHLTKLTVS